MHAAHQFGRDFVGCDLAYGSATVAARQPIQLTQPPIDHISGER
jgi:hypothetical protein